MKGNRIFRGALIFKCSLIALCALVAVVGQGCGSSCALKSGHVSLFNGKDLTGWKVEGGAKWSVVDGVIIGTQGENNEAGDLLTEKIYDDFVLIVSYRVEWPANSGIWFRYQDPKKAYQVDILEYKNPECYSGSFYCPGKLFLAMNTDKDLVNREGWNTMKVRAEGKHIQIYLNGRQVADVHDDATDRGRIGFQIHQGDHFAPMKIAVREIRLMELLRPTSCRATCMPIRTR